MKTVSISSKSEATRVLIVDDHPLTRVGIAHVLGLEPDMQCSGEAENVRQAMEMVKLHSPHIVLCDISIPGDGIELVKSMKNLYPRIPVIIVTMHQEPTFAERAIKAGAMGYLLKSDVSGKIVGAIRKVLCGEVYVSEQIASDMIKILAGGSNVKKGDSTSLLSDRELQVFRLIGEGQKVAEIARELNLSVKTVHVHRSHIMDKMKIQDAHQLSFRAFQWVNQESGGQIPSTSSQWPQT